MLDTNFRTANPVWSQLTNVRSALTVFGEATLDDLDDDPDLELHKSKCTNEYLATVVCTSDPYDWTTGTPSQVLDCFILERHSPRCMIFCRSRPCGTSWRWFRYAFLSSLSVL